MSRSILQRLISCGVQWTARFLRSERRGIVLELATRSWLQRTWRPGVRSTSGLRSTVTAGPAGGGSSAEQPRDASDLPVGGGGGQVASSLRKPCPSTNGQAQTRNVPAFPAAGGTRSTTLAVADAGGFRLGALTPCF